MDKHQVHSRGIKQSYHFIQYRNKIMQDIDFFIVNINTPSHLYYLYVGTILLLGIHRSQELLIRYFVAW